MREKFDLKAADYPDCVNFLDFGSPEEVRTDLRKADLVVMPSPIEPYGLVALEAIAMGVSVLCSSVSGAAKDMETLAGDTARPLIVDPKEGNWTDAIMNVWQLDTPNVFEWAAKIRGEFNAAKKRGCHCMIDYFEE